MNQIKLFFLFIAGVLIMAGCNESSAPNTEEGYISVPGGKIWYKILGKNNPGTPVIVIHGGPGASHTYLKPLEELSAERPVIFYDQLGCGKSERPDDISLWTLPRFVEELDIVRNSLAPEKVHLLGQSWGAALAVEYMLTRSPGNISSLILSGHLLSTSRWIEDQQAYIMQLSEKSRSAILESEKEQKYDTPEYQEAMMEFYKKHVCRLDEWPDYLNQAFEDVNMQQYLYMWGPSEFTVTGTLKDFERSEELKDINIPVLFTCGEYDEATPATCQFYKDNLPESKLFIFKDASHEHHIEKTEDYIKVVNNFLENGEIE